jgi:phage-related protein
MATGFIYDGAAAYATPDKGLSRGSKPSVLVARFGDGYEQRVADGINSLQESYNISFNNRTKAFIDDVVSFLDAKNGAANFTFTLPDSNNTTRTGEKDIKVVCDSYNTTYAYDDFYNLTATLRRVYEP